LKDNTMRPPLFLLSALMALPWIAPPSARGDIILTIDIGVFEPGTRFGTVDIYARSDNADSLIALTVDFELAGGRFLDPPGTFGAMDMIGEGNLNPASDFFRNSDQSASLTLDFNSPQSFSADDMILVSLEMDLSGLSDGFYPITIVDAMADAGRVNILIGSFGQPGGFYIQSVPEPCSMGLCAVGLSWMVWRRRRTQHRRALGDDGRNGR